MLTRMEIVQAALAALAEEALPFDPFEADADADDIADDPSANAVMRLYGPTRNELLNSHPWTFLSVEREELQAASPHDRDTRPEAERGSWPYKYRFLYPERQVGALRALYSRDGREAPEVYDWSVTGPFIYAAYQRAWVSYLANLSEEQTPALLDTALIYALAAALAMPVKEDLETEARMLRKAEMAMNNAKRMDSQGHPPEVITDFTWISAHDGGRGWGNAYGRRVD